MALGPMGRHTPTRIDIKTEGWTTGTDMPLPRDCQTATCIHKDHQLTKALADVELDAEWALHAVLEAQDPPNRGWAAPSSIFMDPTRAHAVYQSRKRWKRGWQRPTGRLSVLCSDMECDKEHTSSLPLDPPLDLPSIAIKRGGLRFYPEFPLCSFHVMRSGLGWQIEVRFHGTQTWHKPPELRFWRRKRADSVRAWLMSHQQNMRALYIDLVNAR